MRNTFRFTLPLLLLAVSAQARAQAEVHAGDRVRVSGPWGSQTRTGTIEAVTADSVVFRTAATRSERVARADLNRIELANGQRRPFVKSTIIGAVLGTAAGAAVGAASYEEPKNGEWCFLGCSRGDDAAFGAMAGGAIGLVVGGIVGLIPRQRWQPARLSTTAGYGRAGATLAFRIAR